MKQATLLVLAVVIQAAFCYKGFDIGTPQGAVSESTFSCLLKEGYQFAIIEAWDGGYHVNPDFASNYKNAQAAGFQDIDVYAFACNNCDGNSPSEVVSGVKSVLPSDFKGTLWLDVEPCDSCWLSPQENLEYVAELAKAAQSAGLNVGVYSSIGSWEGVTGSQSASNSFLTSLPLWYAHYDGEDNFGDTQYYEFGGWKSPSIKQYNDNGADCGTTYDLDFSNHLGANTDNHTKAHKNDTKPHHESPHKGDKHHESPHKGDKHHDSPHKGDKPHHESPHKGDKPHHESPHKGDKSPHKGDKGDKPKSDGGSPSSGSPQSGSPSSGSKPSKSEKPKHDKPKHPKKHQSKPKKHHETKPKKQAKAEKPKSPKPAKSQEDSGNDDLWLYAY